MKKKWQQALGQYLQERQCLSGLVVLMDIRHPLKDLDMQMIEWAVDCDIPVLALLTKCDKLAQSVRMKTVNQVRKELADFGDAVKVEPFSSLKGTGKPKVLEILNDWCHPDWLVEALAEIDED